MNRAWPVVALGAALASSACSRPVAVRTIPPGAVDTESSSSQGEPVVSAAWLGTEPPKIAVMVLRETTTTQKLYRSGREEVLIAESQNPVIEGMINLFLEPVLGVLTLGVFTTWSCYQHAPSGAGWKSPSGAGFALRNWFAFVNPLDQCLVLANSPADPHVRVEIREGDRETVGSPRIVKRGSPLGSVTGTITVQGSAKPFRTSENGLAVIETPSLRSPPDNVMVTIESLGIRDQAVHPVPLVAAPQPQPQATAP